MKRGCLLAGMREHASVSCISASDAVAGNEAIVSPAGDTNQMSGTIHCLYRNYLIKIKITALRLPLADLSNDWRRR